MPHQDRETTEGPVDRLLGAGPAPPPPRPRCSQHRAAASSGALMRPHRNHPRQPVGWGTFTEAPPPVVAPYVEARPADWLLLAVFRPAWAYRLELSLTSVFHEESDKVIKRN